MSMPLARRLAFGLFTTALTLLAIELVVRVAARAGLVQIRTFQVVAPDEVRFVGDLNPHFGVWHVPSTRIEVASPRGPISYETNAHGMRDRERRLQAAPGERVVVLGDSFIEGSGVEEAERVTDSLEAQTGVEFLNFGTSGDFGSIQQWLLYRHLARAFDHSRVFVFLLPDNDFDDNDPARHPTDRYRPYLRRSGESFDLYYPVAFGTVATNITRISAGRRLRRTVYNRWYTLNLFVYRDLSGLKTAVRARTAVASYDTFTAEDLKRLLFSYRQLVELAAPRPVTIFVIPRDKDFLAHAAGRFEGRLLAPLRAFAAAQTGVEVVDLMPAFLDHMRRHGVSHRAFFLGFDPHWSPLGHRVAAEAVLAHLRAGAAVWPKCAAGSALTIVHSD